MRWQRLRRGRCSSGPVDECATNRCNDPSHRLCVLATGLPGYVDGTTTPGWPAGYAARGDCNNTRQAFLCADADSGGFSCTDPNPYWPGDYVCDCAADVPTALLTNGRRVEYSPAVAARCGLVREQRSPTAHPLW